MGSATFKSIYGYDFKNEQDPFFVNGIQASLNLLDASIMSNFLVNLFPTLSKVPDWFPGTAWKRTARKWREQKNCAVNAPYEWAKQRIVTGDFEPSILSALLNDNESGPASSISEDQENELKQLVYGLFIAGTDTTAAGLMNFIAAMVCNPEAQVKAQAEIDSVIGYATRLPTISDEAHLPYLRNLILEVSRWLPIGPTGGPPHVCSEDNVYQGYDIEKGTMIIGNLWAMSRDETVYENPESFEPERFTDPKTPPLPGFGWGRRKCPGMHFAEASLFFVISSLLTTFTFSGKKDENGKEIIPNIEVAHNSLVIPLKPFEFELRPRSEKHRQLIIENIPQD
ncbi:cytochrome P450 family [Rhizoctonia solani]|uniref:Cytochrome P450 family n=1 Tax=Rhizoctonia solani TaxID=456999 RepID=A0A8H7H7H1_9AGAM|nr:cytochrome P450 family [Rhizoctonia solani]